MVFMVISCVVFCLAPCGGAFAGRPALPANGNAALAWKGVSRRREQQ
jgi:hypothetical protein